MLLCGALIALNGEAAEAARSGFALWQNSVMPALLPFFVCTGPVSYTHLDVYKRQLSDRAVHS